MTFTDTIVTGLATGLGASIGSYLGTKHVIERVEKLIKNGGNELWKKKEL